MYTAKIENANGEILTLTGTEAVYQIISIVGVNPPQAQVNTAAIAGLDGALFNSSKLNTRNIVLTVKINGNAEANRLNLYKYFKTKEKCRFYFANDTLDVFIDGYIQNVECDLFSNSETAQISIICPSPYFQSVQQHIADTANVTPEFEFPFSINFDEPVIISTFHDADVVYVENDAETECGAEIVLDVKTPCSTIALNNAVTGEGLVLNYEFREFDRIVINTVKGQKSVTLIRDGVQSNLFSAVQLGSVFFQLVPGNNIIQFLIDGVADQMAVYITFKYYLNYRGV